MRQVFATHWKGVLEMVLMPREPGDGPTAWELIATAVGAAIGMVIYLSSKFGF